MTARDLAAARLELEEGFRAQVYRDSVGKMTIGYGFNIEAGISQRAARALLMAQVTERAEVLAPYWWAQGLDDVRMSVLIDVSFNVGIGGLLHFPKMLAAVGTKNWQTAHDELLDSDAARMLPKRYGRLAQILLSGANE